MKPIPFDSKKDIAPILFDEKVCILARELKRLGITWKPHVGCFVWDPDNFISADSPFPNRIYFILSLPRFIDIFGSVEAIAEKLVWIPTWSQARVVCQKAGVSEQSVANIWNSRKTFSAGEELLYIYELLISALKR